MLFWILIGVIAAAVIATDVMWNHPEAALTVGRVVTIISSLVLAVAALSVEKEVTASEAVSIMQSLTNTKGTEGYAFLSDHGSNVMFKTADGLQTVPYESVIISEMSDMIGTGQVVTTKKHAEYPFVVPWNGPTKTEYVLQVPVGSLGVL